MDIAIFTSWVSPGSRSGPLSMGSLTPVMLSISRALQGMGAGFTVPSALAILTTTYPVGPERTRALSIFGGTASIGSILGVLLDGILGSTIGMNARFT